MCLFSILKYGLTTFEASHRPEAQTRNHRQNELLSALDDYDLCTEEIKQHGNN